MKKKLYISIPILGYQIEGVRQTAKSYKRIWEGRGYDVVTPFDLSNDANKPYSYHMGRNIEGLLKCDTVFFSPGWTESKGCNLEYTAAKIYGKQIIA